MIKSKFQIFSENLKIERKLAKLTQQDMADKLGISQPVYNRYEKGGTIQGREPDFETLFKIAEILKINIDDLFEEK